LRNILSTAALVSERLAVSEDPEVRRVTPRLMQAIDRAVELCSQTLAYSRDGGLPLRRSAVDLAGLAEEVGAELAASRCGEGVVWNVQVPAGLSVQVDRDQFVRVLLNLGRNAIEAGARTVTVTAQAWAGRVSVTVADDGPGLPPRARENLFQPFAGSARAGGTGLGLAIARDVMRAHGGDIRLVDSTAAGTAFVLDLPAGGMSR
jgi:signal transduction histidine kinase